MRGILACLFLCSLHLPLRAQGQQWSVLEITFSASDTTANPFAVTLGCALTDIDGRTLRVPGFYDGRGIWKVRFTPDRPGRWRATTYSSLPELSGIERTLHIADPDTGARGAIRIDAQNPQRLAYQNGRPYHALAFEADWLFALDYGDPELPKTRELLGHARQNGFNQVVMNVYAFDVNWAKDPTLPPELDYGGRLAIYPFGGTNTAPHHSRLNVDFFRHLDRVIELLDAQGMVAHLMIYVWNKGVNWPAAYSEEDNQYFDYIIKRYQAYPNVLWDISKEALGYGHDDIDYITDRIERLRRLDAHERLITVHDYAYCSRFPGKVDLISIQAWSSDLYNTMRDAATRFPRQPVLNIEHGGYERSPYEVFVGNYVDPEVCLRRNYLCAFAGTYSTYYWQGSSWNVILHDPFAGGVSPQPRFDYYRYFQRFFTDHNFTDLRPATNFSASGFCLTDDQDTYLYYVPGENAAIDIKNLPEVDSLELRWFDPFTGTYSEPVVREWSGYFRLRPPEVGRDAILVVRGRE